MLDDLRVMMPDSLFRDKLRGLLRTLSERKRGGLRGLGIIARVSCHGRCHLSRTEKSYGILMARTRPWSMTLCSEMWPSTSLTCSG